MLDLARLNHAWFLLLNGGADTPAWQVAAATVVANGLVYGIPLLLIACWLYGGHQRRQLALRACLVAGVGLAVNQLIGALWPSPRPFVVGLGHTWIPHAADPSFPSNHLVVMASVGLTLLLGRHARLGLLLLLVAGGVGWSRIFLGVHFPLDMVGALAVTAFAWIASAPVWARLGGPLTRWLEGIYARLLAAAMARGWLPGLLAALHRRVDGIHAP